MVILHSYVSLPEGTRISMSSVYVTFHLDMSRRNLRISVELLRQSENMSCNWQAVQLAPPPLRFTQPKRIVFLQILYNLLLGDVSSTY